MSANLNKLIQKDAQNTQFDFQLNNALHRDRISTKKTQPTASMIHPPGSFSSIPEPLQDSQIYYGRAHLHKVLKEGKSNPEHDGVEKVFLHLALCHNIVIDKRTGKMNAASPDELALVEGAKDHGYAFEGKDGNGVITINFKGS